MRKPNVLMVLLDDFGWYNTGMHGNEMAQTPTMDRLALEEGLVLSRHYVYKYCSPTRRSFLTGRYPPHSGQDNSAAATVDYRMETIAEMLKKRGYATAHFGKWHAGHYSMAQTPTRRGFDRHFGYFNGKEDHWTHVDSEDGCGNWTDLWDGDAPTSPGDYAGVYGDELFAARVVETIQDAATTTPFFIYWALQVAHDPMEAPDRCVRVNANTPSPDEYALATLADEAIDNVTTTLQATGAWRHTLMVVSSDNGGPAFSDQKLATNYPLRGGKYTLFEGGVRAAAFLTGGFLPPRLRGKSHNAPVHICDWFATFAALAAGNTTPDDDDASSGVPPLDSVDQWPFLTGAADPDPDRVFFLADSAILIGRYKLITTSPGHAQWSGPLYPQINATGPKSIDCSWASPCLFDVVYDLREMTDLAPARPDLVASLNATLADLMTTVFEGIPDPANNVTADDVCAATNASGGVITPGDFYQQHRSAASTSSASSTSTGAAASSS